MVFGIIIGIPRELDGEPVILAGPARLSQLKAPFKALRKSVDGNQFKRLQLWTNQNREADVKLKPTGYDEASYPVESEPAPPKKRAAK